MTRMKRWGTAAATVCLLLSACGGGDSEAEEQSKELIARYVSAKNRAACADLRDVQATAIRWIDKTSDETLQYTFAITADEAAAALDDAGCLALGDPRNPQPDVTVGF